MYKHTRTHTLNERESWVWHIERQGAALTKKYKVVSKRVYGVTSTLLLQEGIEA